MAKRILTAAIALPVLTFIVWLGSLWFAALIAVVSCLGAWELCRMATAWGQKPIMPFALVLATVLAVSYHCIPGPKHPENMEFIAMIPALAALLAVVVLMFMHSIEGRLGVILVTLSIGLIIGGALFHAPILRDFEFFRDELDDGARWIFFLLGVTFAADTVAYFVSRAIGSRRLNQNTTWGGAVGGILAAVVCGVFLGSALDLGAPAPIAAVVSVILAISGQLGAMFVAKLKRMSAVENTGRLLPGYGGVLDRMGSVMWGVVILYHLVALSSGSTA